MTRLLWIEISKVMRRPRTYLGYLGVLLLLIPYLLAFHYGRPEDFIRHRVGSDFEVVGSFFNALFLARLIMEPPVLVFFMPLFVATVAGDLVAGEAAEGTLRALLVRPVSRAKVLAAKFLVAVLHSGALTLFLGAASLGLGALFFGVGDLFVFDQGLYVFPLGEGLLRLLGAYTAAVAGMVVVASFALLFSVLVDNSIFAIGGAMMLLVVSGILGVLPFFENARPYLFTTHMSLWRHLLADPIPWGEAGRSLAWLAGYGGLCLAAALAIFHRKDILS